MQFPVHSDFILQAGAARCIRSELELAELTQHKKLCCGAPGGKSMPTADVSLPADGRRREDPKNELELAELTQHEKLCFREKKKCNFVCIWISEFTENQQNTDYRIGIGIDINKSIWTSVLFLRPADCGIEFLCASLQCFVHFVRA